MATPTGGQGGFIIYTGIEGVDQTIRGLDDIGKAVDRNTKRTHIGQKASRNANLALVELGRGASDARFGFHGLGNNLQRMVEIFGDLRNRAGSTGKALKALGGALLGPGAVVAGISILIAYGPEIYNFFKTWIQGSSEAADALDKFEESLAKAGETQEGKHAKLIGDAIAEAQKNYDDAVKTFETKVSQGFRNLDDELMAVQKAQEKLNILLNKRNKLNEENRKKATEAQQLKTYKLISESLGRDLELMKAMGKTKEELLNHEIMTLSNLSETLIGTENYEKVLHRIKVLKAELSNIPLDKSSGKASFLVDPKIVAKGQEAFDKYLESIKDIGRSVDDIRFDKFKSDIEAVNLLFRQGKIDADEYLDRLSNLSTDYNEDSGIKKTGEDAETTAEIMQRFSGTVAGSLSNAADAGDNFAANFGSSILKAIGNFLVAEGVAAIASGKTKVASGFLSGIGLAQINAGWAEVGIGAALKAGGSALSPSSANASGGGGASGQEHQRPSAVQGNQQFGAGTITGSRGIRSTVTRADEIRYNQQVAADTYQAYS